MKWKDIERERIQWLPTIDTHKCTGCKACFEFCCRSVYQIEDGTAKIENPYNCLASCSNCQSVCPVGAISFPNMKKMREIIRELREKLLYKQNKKMEVNIWM